MIGEDFIFVHINRTGGMATTRLFKPNRGSVSGLPIEEAAVDFRPVSHWKAEEYKRALGDEGYFKRFRFTIVRNPWDRMVSYHVGTQMKGMMVKDRPIDRDEFNKYTLMALGPMSGWDDVMSRRFRHRVANRRYVEPCSSWVDLGELNGVARTENLKNDLYIMLDRLEKFGGRKLVRHEMTRFNNSDSYRASDYRGYYSEETRRKVAEHFAVDIENFGYGY